MKKILSGLLICTAVMINAETTQEQKLKDFKDLRKLLKMQLDMYLDEDRDLGLSPENLNSISEFLMMLHDDEKESFTAGLGEAIFFLTSFLCDGDKACQQRYLAFFTKQLDKEENQLSNTQGNLAAQKEVLSYFKQRVAAVESRVNKRVMPEETKQNEFDGQQ